MPGLRVVSRAVPRLLAASRSPLLCFAILFVVFACARPPAARRIFTKTGFSMGTVAEIKIVHADSAAANAALDGAFAELARIEALATIHDPASEVSRLNAKAGAPEPVPVGPDLDAILRLGVRVARETGGAFDPTVGPLLRLWGFPEDPAVPDSAAILGALAFVGWERLERVSAEADGARWRLRDPGMSIDLGGIACGVGVDRAGEVLRRVSPDFLVNIGGDILVGGVKPDSSAWSVAIQDPRDLSRFVMTLRLRGPAALSTSGDYEHFVMNGNVREHHLLDPKTGWPGRDFCSVTVIAPDCARADVLSKPAFLMGKERAIDWVENDPDLEGVFIVENADASLAVRETSGVAELKHLPASPAPAGAP